MDLQKFIDQQGMTRKAFAEQVGVTPEAVRLWMCGKRIPRPRLLREIMLATGGAVTVYDFIKFKR